jgi:hypothetical protein
MPAIELVLVKPKAPEEKLSLFFNLHNNLTARKYFRALQECIAENNKIYDPDRFYNFPNSPRDRHWIAAQINRCIDVINDYSPGLIKHRAASHMNQELMNHLHHYFEVHRGPILNPPKFFSDAPMGVKRALEDLNLLIHRYEDFERNEDYLSKGWDPAAKIVLTYDERRYRYDLEDEDYRLFTKRTVFGRWYINYCEVGKPLWDFYQDQDEVIGDSNILPLRYLSGDAMIEFSRTMTEEDHQHLMQKFWAWWDKNEKTLSRLGFKKHDPRNAIGEIPVADLDRTRGAVAGLSEKDIRELIGSYQLMSRVRAIP